MTAEDITKLLKDFKVNLMPIEGYIFSQKGNSFMAIKDSIIELPKRKLTQEDLDFLNLINGFENLSTPPRVKINYLKDSPYDIYRPS